MIASTRPLLRLLFLLALHLGLSACVMFNSEAPTISKTMRAESALAIEDAATDVFTSAGFRFTSKNTDSVTFQRAASKTDEVLYGNWNDSESVERVVVRYEPAKPGFYKVWFLAYAVRGGGGMEDTSRRAGLFNAGYKTLLRGIEAELLSH